MSKDFKGIIIREYRDSKPVIYPDWIIRINGKEFGQDVASIRRTSMINPTKSDYIQKIKITCRLSTCIANEINELEILPFEDSSITEITMYLNSDLYDDAVIITADGEQLIAVKNVNNNRVISFQYHSGT